MMKKIRPAFKCHGGKYYLSEFIISNFPQDYEQMVYVEPYCGAANVLLNKAPSSEEVINDLDGGIYYILRTIRDACESFVTILSKTKYNKKNFNAARKQTTFRKRISPCSK